MRYSKERGFTLVEIAIVLVVIGLLLGGILKGQQLISSDRVRNLAEQNQGDQAADYSIMDRFGNMPSDMRCDSARTAIGRAVSADCTSAEVGGNGNGRIETVKEAG